MIEYENLKKSNAVFFPDYRIALDKVLESGWFVLGNEVSSFEQEFAAYCESNYCVGVANGLDALHLALLALELPLGSEVLVPSNTYIATILAIVQAGLKPVLVEPNISTYNIDPLLLNSKLTIKTSAVMVVHLYGKMCDMDPIILFCKKNGLKLIEDCAQAHGAMYKGKKAGSFGDFGAFSFYPTKNLGCLGDGGALVTSDLVLAEKVKELRNYGSKIKYYNDIPGWNSRLDEIQAAFLRIKLKKLDEINNHKRLLAKNYRKRLGSAFVLPVEEPDFFDVYHIFNIRHQERNRLKEFLLKNEIKTDIHYPVAPNKQKAMLGILDCETPIAEEIHNTTLSLPISYYHTINDIEIITNIMMRFQ